MTKKLTSVFERTGRLAAALTVCLSLAQGSIGWLSPPRDLGACQATKLLRPSAPAKSVRCGP